MGRNRREQGMIQEERIRGYIETVVSKCFFRTLDSIEIQTIPGGQGHWLYKVICRWKENETPSALLLRIKIDISSAYERAKSEREARVLAFLNGKISPRLFDFDTSGQWFSQPVMCLSYIEGRAHCLNKLPVERLKQLGKTVAWLHSIKADQFDINFYEEEGQQYTNPIDYLISRLEWDISRIIPKEDMGLPPAPIIRRFWEVHDRVYRYLLKKLNRNWLDDHLTLSLLHTDLGSDNIVWTPENNPVLIDWEYTRMGDPAEEIAYIFTENQLEEAHRKAFWDGYSEQLPWDIVALKDRVLVWQPVTAFGAIWWLDRYIRSIKVNKGILEDKSIQNQPEFYLERAVTRLDYVEQTLDRLES